jgi:hypothetical protein
MQNDVWPPREINLRDPRWLAPGEAAHIANVDERTVRRWARRFPIAVWTLGGRCWIARDRLFLVGTMSGMDQNVRNAQ